MSLQVGKETIYNAEFQRSLDQSTQPNWIKSVRENAFQSFIEKGFPTLEEEEWKYTNVAPIAKEKFDVILTGPEKIENIERFVYEEARTSQIVFINGVLDATSTELSSLPQGVVALDLDEALHDEKYERLIKERLARVADYNANGFAALNTAFISNGAFLFIPKNTKVETPIHLLFISASESKASFPRVLIVAERGSEATIIENYTGATNGKYFTNAVVEIVLEDDARLDHYRVQRESNTAFHIGTTATELGRGSSYNATSITLGARLSRHNIKLSFNQPGSEAWVDGLYFVGDGQHTDTHSLIDHREPHCTSHQLYKGILDGKSRAVFNGKVFVHKDAQQTDAQQTNKNLLLSTDARVDTKPQLEIFNDDVKCSHGATVGQLEDEELFYLLSRGLHTDLARNLLTYGFAEEVIDKIKIESIRRQLDEAVLSSLHATLEA